MAVPLSSAADREEELVEEFVPAGYTQLPADHLSDSPDSSVNDDGRSTDITYSTPETSQQTDSPTATGNGGHVVHINGLEIHVYGQVAGMQLSETAAHGQHNLNLMGIHDDGNVDDDERQRQHEEDTALVRAIEAEDARRSAPLPPDRCQAIKNAMQSISLGGFRPEWADRVPEEQWVNRLKRKLMSKHPETEEQR